MRSNKIMGKYNTEHRETFYSGKNGGNFQELEQRVMFHDYFLISLFSYWLIVYNHEQK